MIDVTLDRINKIVPNKWQWILNHSGFRKYFKNTGWMFFGQMFSLLVSFFIGAWIARYLGPEKYGIINYVVAFVGLFGFISSLGVDGVLNREFVNFPERKSKILGTATVIKFVGGFFVVIFSSFVGFFLENDGLIRLLIFIFSLSFIFQSGNSILFFFQANTMGRTSFKVQMTSCLLSSVIKVIIIMMNVGIIWIIITYVIDVFIFSAGLIFAYRKQGLKLNDWTFDKSYAKLIIIESWPLVFSGAMSFLLLKVDQIMISNILGNVSAGIYAVAVKISESLYFIPGILCASLFPAIIKNKNSNINSYYHRFRLLLLFLFVMAVFLAILISIFAGRLIILLFGSQYVESISVLKIYIWSGVGFFLGYAINQYLIIENRAIFVFFVNLIAIIINIFLNLFLIKTIGVNGAAIATVLAYLVPIIFIFYKNYDKNYKSN